MSRRVSVYIEGRGEYAVEEGGSVYVKERVSVYVEGRGECVC